MTLQSSTPCHSPITFRWTRNSIRPTKRNQIIDFSAAIWPATNYRNIHQPMKPLISGSTHQSVLPQLFNVASLELYINKQPRKLHPLPTLLPQIPYSHLAASRSLSRFQTTDGRQMFATWMKGGTACPTGAQRKWIILVVAIKSSGSLILVTQKSVK